MPAAVDVDHGRAVGRALVRLGALARGVDRLVLEQHQRVGALARDDAGVDLPLQRPPLVVRHEVGGEARVQDVEHGVSSPRGSFMDRVQQYAGSVA